MNFEALHARLDDSARFDAEYGHNLASHLPMALSALHRLGADAARLATFADGYSHQLHAMPPAEPWPAGDPWQGRLGDPRAWPVYRNLFREWLLHEGPADLLQPVLPVLMRGCGAAAFHGLIRVAHAVEAGHAVEMADALAYWACRWFTLGDARGKARTDAPALAVQGLRLPLPQAPLIAERMALVAAAPSFPRAAAALGVDERHTLPRLAAWAASTYAETADFTVLHLVTSAHAVRVLLPWLDEGSRLPALRHYATAYLAGCASTRLRPLTPLTPPTPLKAMAWPAIIRRALAHDDEHVIKLVDSCREHQRAYGDGPWRAAATRAVTPGQGRVVGRGAALG
jgi:Questin oxidase-like